MSDYTSDPAFRMLAPADFARVCAVAGSVVDLYGGGGPPFPITQLLAMLDPSTELIGITPTGRDGQVYGYAFPIDFARHSKHAALVLNTEAPPDEVFITAFHEAGHVLLHILPERSPTEPFYDRRAGRIPSPDVVQAEVEADLFARLTTMPAPWVRRAWPAVAMLRPANAVAGLAAQFCVPPAWMDARLRVLGLLP